MATGNEKSRSCGTIPIRCKFASLPLLLILMSLHCTDYEAERPGDAGRNLANSTSSFIYNAIPPDPAASITAEYSTAINGFSVRLLDAVYGDSSFTDRNVVMSPFSLGRSLAILAAGASGKSRSELLGALGGQAALDDAREALSKLLYADVSIILQCADAIWIDSLKYSLSQSFRQAANSEYGVECSGLDLSDAIGAARIINDWTSANTGQYITDIVSADDFASSTVLFLTNAIYFEADWTSPFDVTKTKRAPFHSPGGTVMVDMMNSSYLHKTRKTATYENAKVFYGTAGADFFYLDIYMPTGISIEEFLGNVCLSALSSDDSSDTGSLTMPKFSFENDIDMMPMLRQLGITEIFNSANTDLAGIAQYAGNADSVYIYVDRVIHVAGIETDEEGTKAYAITVARGTAGSAGPGSPDVILDNPFVYFIRAGANGLVLFAGVVNDPRMP